MLSNFLEIVCFKAFSVSKCFIRKQIIFLLGLALRVSLLVV